MKQRFNIIQIYFGKFDSKQIIACTDDLMNAVHIVELLNKASEGTCYTYDFIKIHHLLDPIKDFYPGNSLCSKGTCLTCTNYKEYKEQKEEWNKQSENTK